MILNKENISMKTKKKLLFFALYISITLIVFGSLTLPCIAERESNPATTKNCKKILAEVGPSKICLDDYETQLLNLLPTQHKNMKEKMVN